MAPSSRVPPLALAAAAGVHLLILAAGLLAWEGGKLAENVRVIEIELAALLGEPERAAAEPAPAPSEETPETTPPSVTAIDPSAIPPPDPPPPPVFEAPKPFAPSPPKPRPAARPAAPVPPTPQANTAPTAPLLAPAAPSVQPALDPGYLDGLATAIEREREYPHGSRRQGHQGRIVLTLVIAASDIAMGSGVEALDRAALAMVRRARLPPLPPAMAPGPASFTVPIVFALR